MLMELVLGGVDWFFRLNGFDFLPVEQYKHHKYQVVIKLGDLTQFPM